MGVKNKLKQTLGRVPTDDEVALTKRITEEQANIIKDVEEFVKSEISKGYLVGSLRFLNNAVQNAVDKEIFKTNAYFDIIKARKELDERALNELSLVDSIADVVRMQNDGYTA